MIKKIQLRGISRSPSDKITEDGGCAESMNVQLEGAESAPAPIPKNVSTQWGVSGTIYPQFIHKLPSGDEIMISLNSGTLYASKKGTTTGSSVTIANAPSFSPAVDSYFTAIGNILVHYTTVGGQGSVYYYIYNNGQYTYLGNNLPTLNIDVLSRHLAPAVYSADVPTSALQTPNLRNFGSTDPEDQASFSDMVSMWNDVATGSKESPAYSQLLSTMQNVWESAALAIDEQRQAGNFVAPFFIRYALRLYDGSYIYTSTPILCGAGTSSDWLTIEQKIGDTNGNFTHKYYWVNGYGYDEDDNAVDDGTGYSGYRMRLSFNCRFQLRLKGSFSASGWSDFITAIDIFATPPIMVPALNGHFGKMSQNGYNLSLSVEGLTTAAAKSAAVKEEILAASQFYLIKSIDINNQTDMATLSGGTMSIANSPAISGDTLYTQKNLPDGYRDRNTYLPINGVTSYNSRLMMAGVVETLTKGDAYLNGQAAVSIGGESLKGFAFRYKIVAEDGTVHYVVANYGTGTGTTFKPSFLDYTYTQYHGNETPSVSGAGYLAGNPYSWLCYPDSRCVQVEVYFYNTSGTLQNGRVIPMTPHPNLECSYAFFGLGRELYDLKDDANYINYNNAGNLSSENRTISSPNRLVASDFQNPFKVSAEGIITFSDEVIGVATTSAPLSEGQFGQFPLYVFTAGGIKALEINSVGDFYRNTTPANLARYVAFKGTILGLEQTVVFTCERGVMLLSGSSVQCVSDVMNGRHYCVTTDMSGDLYDHIGTWTGSSVINIEDTDTFMKYMKSAVPAYDFNGARLIFTKETAAYHYIYMLKSGTWHKMSSPSGTASKRPINSFPECLIAGQSVYDYSTVIDDKNLMTDNTNTRYCVAVTRPFDLGEPDVRKAIKSIRIRGRYNKGDVQYVLLGSMDGDTWKIMTSLRGGSYKMFRMVILATLAPTERISWIDIDYEPRMTNRLR